jgi:hypothetical protein
MDYKANSFIVDDQSANIDLLRAPLGDGYRIRAVLEPS